jgi:hypothetical protein
MTVEDAFIIAISRLAAEPGQRERDAAQMLWEIARRRGCERFDPACDGRLLDLISIIMRG